MIANDNDQEVLELLSRVLAVEPSQDGNAELLSNLKTSVIELESLLVEGSVNAVEALEELGEQINRLELYNLNPVFLGKCQTALLYDSMRARTDFYKNIFGTSKYQPILLKDNPIPLLHSFSDEPRIQVTNRFLHKETLTEAELYNFIKYYTKDNQMDLKDVLNPMLIEAGLPFKHLTFSDINLKSNYPGTEKFLKNMDIVIINLFFTKDWQNPIRYIKEIGYENNIFILVPEKRDELTQELKNLKLDAQVIEGTDYKKIHNLLKARDRLINNTHFTERFEVLLLKLLYSLQQKLSQYQRKMEAINKSILFGESEEKKVLGQIRSQIQEEIDEARASIDHFQKISDKIMQQVENVEEVFKQGLKLKGASETFSKESFERRYELISFLIENQEYDRAKNLIQDLLALGYNRAHILLAMLQKKRGLKPLKLSLEKIAALPNSQPLNIEAKISHSKELGLNRSQLITLSVKLKDTFLPEAIYYKGLYFETSNTDLSIYYYKQAFEAGSTEAGDRLFALWKKKDMLTEENLTYLGDLLHGEANYLLAMDLPKVNKRISAVTVIAPVAAPMANFFGNLRRYRLSLASASGYRKATNELINTYMEENQYDRAIHACLFALEKHGAYEKYKEILGQAYFFEKEYIKAYEVLSNVNTGLSYFLLGQMYEKGYGRNINLKKALDHYQKGKNLKSNEAHSQYLKLSTRLEQEKKEKESKTTSYSSNRSYSSSSYSSSSKSSSSCFLTTATCKALGKEDDCEEILAFKAFRDSWLLQQDDGISIIKEYYKIAPVIVERINTSENPLGVYTYLWETFMEKGYGYLLNQDFQKAKDIYIKMVLELKEEYYK